MDFRIATGKKLLDGSDLMIDVVSIEYDASEDRYWARTCEEIYSGFTRVCTFFAVGNGVTLSAALQDAMETHLTERARQMENLR